MSNLQSRLQRYCPSGTKYIRRAEALIKLALMGLPLGRALRRWRTPQVGFGPEECLIANAFQVLPIDCHRARRIKRRLNGLLLSDSPAREFQLLRK
jgi:hypothetical protein